MKPLTQILFIFAVARLLLIAGIGALCCVMGFEAIAAGINPVPWLMTLVLLVILPLGGAVWRGWFLVRKQ